MESYKYGEYPQRNVDPALDKWPLICCNRYGFGFFSRLGNKKDSLIPGHQPPVPGGAPGFVGVKFGHFFCKFE